MAGADRQWTSVEAEVQRGAASGYDAAACILTDLADAHAHASGRAVSECALRRFPAHHAKRTALLHRLADAGLLPA